MRGGDTARGVSTRVNKSPLRWSINVYDYMHQRQHKHLCKCAHVQELTLPNAPAHAAKHAAKKVGEALRHTPSVAVPLSLRDLIDQVEGHHGFNQADQGHDDRQRCDHVDSLTVDWRHHELCTVHVPQSTFVRYVGNWEW